MTTNLTDLAVSGDVTAATATIAAATLTNLPTVGGVAQLATMSEINRICDASTRVVNITTTPLAIVEATHEGKTITLNKADGIAVTLPAATGSGDRLKFVIGTTITSVGITIKVTGNDIMTGVAQMVTDTAGVMIGFGTAADSDTITLNGTTTGGIKGQVVFLEDIATDLWQVFTAGTTTGTSATPFSATV